MQKLTGKSLWDSTLERLGSAGESLIIGGGIANFTDLVATFTGLIQALTHYAADLKEHTIKHMIRCAAPSYTEGLREVGISV